MLNRREKSRFEMPHVLLKLISWMVLKIFFKFELQGMSYLQKTSGGLILAGNHTGLLDSLIIFSATSARFLFLMTEEVFEWPWIGPWLRYGNILPIYKGREARAMMQSIHYLKQGGTICIFPEGKLTDDGQLNPFHPGVAFLQVKTSVPIVPFCIYGGFEAWSFGKPWPTFRKIILKFGPPIEPALCVNRQQVVKIIEESVRAMQRELAQAENWPTQPQPVV